MLFEIAKMATTSGITGSDGTMKPFLFKLTYDLISNFKNVASLVVGNLIKWMKMEAKFYGVLEKNYIYSK